MQPLEQPAAIRTVLSFDFDGTLHDPAGEPPVPKRFFDTILRLREEHGAVWGINTGRSIPYVVEGMLESGFPFAPDWVVAREREIYHFDPAGHWHARETWNQRCHHAMHALFDECRELLDVIRHEIREHTGAEWMELEGDPAGVIARTEEEMAWILPRVEAIAGGHPHLGWQRNSIWLRFGHRDYHKGSSLAEVARHYGLDATDCFAVGDSHNDFEMLDPRNAAKFACPGNAVAEVKAHVAQLGGYLAERVYGDGAVEALEHFFPEC
jgi:hydroxymethylpyrimidine pyrophosphatase-like HAD family hydrolase